MKIIDGKAIAANILKEIKVQIKGEHPPGLAFVLIGNDLASQTYVSMKKKACENVGMFSQVIELDAQIEEKKLIGTIDQLNQDPKINGILVQQPLPPHLNLETVVSRISAKKDVDGFHPLNLGKLMMGDMSGFIPCTPLGIHTLLTKSNIEVKSKRVVILGRSNIVGKPLASLLTHYDATVTIAHSKSQNLPELCSEADILISAVGRPNLVTPQFVKKGAVVIDVGINRENGNIVGDVNFDAVAPLTSAITPVPGGVGPMTIAMLLQNTLKSTL